MISAILPGMKELMDGLQLLGAIGAEEHHHWRVRPSSMGGWLRWLPITNFQLEKTWPYPCSHHQSGDLDEA